MKVRVKSTHKGRRSGSDAFYDLSDPAPRRFAGDLLMNLVGVEVCRERVTALTSATTRDRNCRLSSKVHLPGRGPVGGKPAE